MAVADMKNRRMNDSPATASDLRWQTYARRELEHVMPGLKTDDLRWLLEQLSPRALLQIAVQRA